MKKKRYKQSELRDIVFKCLGQSYWPRVEKDRDKDWHQEVCNMKGREVGRDQDAGRDSVQIGKEIKDAARKYLASNWTDEGLWTVLELGRMDGHIPDDLCVPLTPMPDDLFLEMLNEMFPEQMAVKKGDDDGTIH